MTNSSANSASAKTPPRWRKPVLVILFILLNVAVIAITAVNEFGNTETAVELSEVKINGWLLVPALLCFVLASLANTYKYVLMIRDAKKRETSEKPSNSKNSDRLANASKRITSKSLHAFRLENRANWKTAFRVVFLGKYYDNITPAAIGGQPFQIYYMHKNSDLKSGPANAIPIFGMIAGQIGFLVIALLCFTIGSSVIHENPVLMTSAWIGLLFYAFWPVMVMGVIFFPHATTKFINFFVKILAKVKIVKNREEKLKNVEHEINEYARSTKLILKSKKLFFSAIFLAIVCNFLFYSIPYFVLEAFGGDMDFLECLITTMAVTSAVYYIPTPGNAGAAEGTFYMVFSALSTGYVFWAMLIWRFFSYYIYIMIGPLIYFRMHLEKKRGIINKYAKIT